MTRVLISIFVLSISIPAFARIPSDTDLNTMAPAEASAARLVTCKLNGFSEARGGTATSTLVDVHASSIEEAIHQSVSTQSESVRKNTGEIQLLKIEMGGGQSMWADSVSCGDVRMQVADCCANLVCGCHR